MHTQEERICITIMFDILLYFNEKLETKVQLFKIIIIP